MRVFFSLIGRNTSSLYISIKADSLEEKAVVGGAIKKPWVFFTKLKVLILPLILMIEYDKFQKKCLFCSIKLSEILGSSLESKKPIGIACPMGSMRPIGIGKNRTPKTPNRPALTPGHFAKASYEIS